MDYKNLNGNSLKIIEALNEKKHYFNELHEKTGIRSKNNLLRNLNSLTQNGILIKEKNKSNTFYSINYSNSIAIALLNLINNIKFSGLPYNIRTGILESIFALKPKIAILFGSYVKGNYKKESDVDLLFFESEDNLKERVREISKSYGIKLNITLMNLKELNLKSEPMMHIFKTGYPLVGENYFYNELKKEI
ncbi:MAG: nucleotidyltransferase domain-containing protein [archaeon]|nr:nucleotidyltransferase domain-containing protein [archaeon]